MSYELPPFMQKILNKVSKYFFKYQKQILITITAIFALIIVTTGYYFYAKSREERAHAALVQAFEYFNAPVVEAGKEEETIDFTEKKTFTTDAEKWAKVADIFKKGYEANKSSGVSGMFLAFYSEGLLQQGNIKEAITVLSSAIPKINNKDLRAFYTLKKTLMKLDSKDGALINEGLLTLTKLAADESGIAHDSALYNLGSYYWAHKNFDEAKNYWNQLLLKYGKDSEQPSVWASVAEEKLRLLDSKIK